MTLAKFHAPACIAAARWLAHRSRDIDGMWGLRLTIFAFALAVYACGPWWSIYAAYTIAYSATVQDLKRLQWRGERRNEDWFKMGRGYMRMKWPEER